MYYLYHTGKASPDASCYVFQLVASPSLPVIAASNSNHTIKLYSRSDLQFLSECPPIHQATIRDLCWSPTSPHWLLSCDGAGVMVVTDTRQPRPTRVPLSLQCPEQVFSFDLRQCGNVLALGDGMDTVLFDMRRASVELQRVSDFHSDDITQVRFHPLHRDVLCTASEDGLVNVLDLTKPDDDDDLLRWVFNVGDPVAKLSFFGDRCENVAAVTTTEAVALASLDSGDVRGKLPRQTEETYIVDCAFATMYGRHELLVFSGNKSIGMLGSVDVQFVQPCGFSPQVGAMIGGHTDLVRSVLCLEDGATLITAGEDGVVCLWRPQPRPDAPPDRVAREHPADSTDAAAAAGKRPRKAQFTPY